MQYNTLALIDGIKEIRHSFQCFFSRQTCNFAMVKEERELKWFQEALLIEEKLAQLDQLLNESNQTSSTSPQNEPLNEIADSNTSNNNVPNLLIDQPEKSKSGSIEQTIASPGTVQIKTANSIEQSESTIATSAVQIKTASIHTPEVEEARPGLYIAIQTFYPPSQEFIYIAIKTFVKVFTIKDRICNCENQSTNEVGLIPLDYLLPLSFEFLLDLIKSEQQQVFCFNIVLCQTQQRRGCKPKQSRRD
jgi:hypothetical protein